MPNSQRAGTFVSTTALMNLATLGIVQELTGKQRNRMFYYPAYLKILEQGTEPLP